jgi:hypothetical protein
MFFKEKRKYLPFTAPLSQMVEEANKLIKKGKYGYALEFALAYSLDGAHLGERDMYPGTIRQSTHQVLIQGYVIALKATYYQMQEAEGPVRQELYSSFYLAHHMVTQKEKIAKNHERNMALGGPNESPNESPSEGPSESPSELLVEIDEYKRLLEEKFGEVDSEAIEYGKLEPSKNYDSYSAGREIHRKSEALGF